MTVFTSIRSLAAALAAGALVACATPSISTFDSAEISDASALSSVQSVYVAPVTFELEKFVSSVGPRTGAGGQRPVSDKDLETLAADLRDDIQKALAKSGLTVVDEPTPGAATVSAVLTKVASSRPSFAELSDEPSLSAQSIYAGGGDVRITITSGDDTLAVLTDSESSSLGDGQPRVGIWSDLKSEFRRWANGVAAAFKD